MHCAVIRLIRKKPKRTKMKIATLAMVILSIPIIGKGENLGLSRK